MLECDFPPDLTTDRGRRCVEALRDAAMREDDSADGTWLALLGCFFLLIGAVVLWRLLWFFRSAARTTGTVVDLHVRQHDEGDAYHPVVRFVTLEGTTERFTEDTRAGKKRYQIGQTVAVAYDPKYPGRARVLWWGMYAMPLVMFPLGGMLLVLGLLVRFGRL